jgi:hypothetical protein
VCVCATVSRPSIRIQIGSKYVPILVLFIQLSLPATNNPGVMVDTLRFKFGGILPVSYFWRSGGTVKVIWSLTKY